MTTKIYKVRDTRTGLFSTSGLIAASFFNDTKSKTYRLQFTQAGKVWSRPQDVKAHLRLYTEYSRGPYNYGGEIPECLEVATFDVTEAGLTKARDFK